MEEREAKKREAEVGQESPSRPAKKVAGGVKIPGLLEGLMGSKRFNKNENKQLTSSMDKPSSTSTSSLISAPKPSALPQPKPTTGDSVSGSLSKPSPPAPAPRPKPVALPRVLPTLPSKPLRSPSSQSSVNLGNSADTKFSMADTLSKKPALRSTGILEKLESGKVPLSAKKDPEPSVASTKLSPGKTSQPSRPLSPAKETKVSSSVSPSKILPSAVGSEKRKTSLGQVDVKTEVRKKPPVVMKKPTLKSRPDKTPVQEKKDLTVSGPGKVHSKLSDDTKLKENTSSSSKFTTNVRTTSADDSIDGKVRTPEILAKEKSTEKAMEDSFVVIDKSDFEREQKSVPIPTVAAPVTSSLKETAENVVSPKRSSGELFEDEDFSILDIPDTASKSKEIVKDSTPSSSSFSKFTPSSSQKPSESTKSESKKDISTAPSVVVGKTTPTAIPTPKPTVTPTATVTPTPTPTKPPGRKSSVSGMSSVKPPSSSDKTSSSSKPSASPVGSMGRRDSITGSAYNPIGFRSPLGGSDSGSETRSRGSSVSSDKKSRGDSVSSTGSDLAKKMPDLKSSGHLPRVSSESPEKDKGDVMMRKKPENPEARPSWLTEVAKNSLNRTRCLDSPDKTKQAADEANRIIQDKSSLRKVSPASKSPATTTASNKSEAQPEDKKASSPWGVRLRKVDSVRPKSVVEPPNNENSSPGVNWRQQMSQKRQSFVPPKELETPKQQDSTPEWAKASMQRRQRLLDAGVINSDAK
ncbi:hypothetical protein EGW08_012482 [Elysia chlorotica]|uniref:Uncharacterized protein n=1 Tax=Elysia chlorotica TaxID=188477 RepID=A0A3S1BBQ9_ELYCH|nr:hypothetical protein EGW08_012482 [Elysia chlorotica]